MAIPLQVLKKGSVEISMDGMPSFSNSMLLSRPLELQLPQSPWVRIMASHRSTSFHSSLRITLEPL